jgi:hypothetical protein
MQMGKMVWCVRVSRYAVCCIAAISLLVTTASCAANLADSAKLDDQEGVLITKITTNFRGQISVLDATRTVLLAVSPGENFKFVRLHAGVYNWAGVQIGQGRCDFRGPRRFAIWPNVINYIGDLEVEFDSDARKCYSQLAKRSIEAQVRIARYYPQFSTAHKFVMSLAAGGEGFAQSENTDIQALDPQVARSVVLAQVSAIRDQFCACRDQVCVEHVSSAIDSWNRTSGQSIDRADLLPQEQAQFDDSLRRLRACALHATEFSGTQPAAATTGPAYLR